MVQGIRLTCDGFDNTRDTLGSCWVEVSVLTATSHSSHGYQKPGFIFKRQPTTTWEMKNKTRLAILGPQFTVMTIVSKEKKKVNMFRY